LEPGGHGRAATPVRTGRERAIAGPDRSGDLFDRRARVGPDPARRAHDRRPGRRLGWRSGTTLQGGLPPGWPDRAGLLPQWWDPADGPPPARPGVGTRGPGLGTRGSGLAPAAMWRENIKPAFHGLVRSRLIELMPTAGRPRLVFGLAQVHRGMNPTIGALEECPMRSMAARLML